MNSNEERVQAVNCLHEVIDIISEILDHVSELNSLSSLDDKDKKLFLKNLQNCKSQKNLIKQEIKIHSDLLKKIGLSGNHLKYKYNRLRKAYDGDWKNNFRIRDKLFGWINTILGSLSAVIPSVHILKEFKEGIENEKDIIFPN